MKDMLYQLTGNEGEKSQHDELHEMNMYYPGILDQPPNS